ncbi:hypothetical protein BTHE68_32450 [Burkholderia sp. THE68]|nr:hypothetical protein BTHE68_32450 [Burkholderia sp. THE68]
MRLRGRQIRLTNINCVGVLRAVGDVGDLTLVACRTDRHRIRPIRDRIAPSATECVDSESTVDVTVLKPVEAAADSESTLDVTVLQNVEEDVDSKSMLDVTLLKPVESEFTPEVTVLRLVEVDVDSEPIAASVSTNAPSTVLTCTPLMVQVAGAMVPSEFGAAPPPRIAAVS